MASKIIIAYCVLRNKCTDVQLPDVNIEEGEYKENNKNVNFDQQLRGKKRNNIFKIGRIQKYLFNTKTETLVNRSYRLSSNKISYSDYIYHT